MRTRVTGLASSGAALVVAGVLIGGQVLSGASSGAGLQPGTPAAATSSTAADDVDDDADEACADDTCGNEHSRAIHAWVRCKAEKGKAACPKPAPPGRALGHDKHSGHPVGANGHGKAWGQAHAPGQLKTKDKDTDPDDDPDDETP
jgi:hypothetical protein